MQVVMGVKKFMMLGIRIFLYMQKNSGVQMWL